MCVKCTQPENYYARAFVATPGGYALPANDQYTTIDELNAELEMLHALYAARKHLSEEGE